MNKGQLIVMLVMYTALIPIFLICSQSYASARIGVYPIWADLIAGNTLRYILASKHKK